MIYVSVFIIAISFSSKNIVYAVIVNAEEIALEGLTEEDAKRRLLQSSVRPGSIDALTSGRFKEVLVADDWIAVGNEDNVVGVFECDGQMKYCVRFTTTGGYSLHYDSNAKSLVIKIARNNTYYTFDTNGKLCRMADYQSHYADTLSGTALKDKTGSQYYLETERRASSLFLKQRTLVIKKNKEECEFLISDFRYDKRAFIFIFIGISAILTGIWYNMENVFKRNKKVS